MLSNALLFIPNNFSAEKSGFVEGFYKRFDDNEGYFITNPSVYSQCKNRIGYVDKNLRKLPDINVFFDCDTSRVYLKCQEEGTSASRHETKPLITEVYYDYETFKGSDIVLTQQSLYGTLIIELLGFLRRNKAKKNGTKSGLLHWLFIFFQLLDGACKKFKHSTLLKNCIFLSHFQTNFQTGKWFFKSLSDEKQFTPKHGNISIAKLIDFLMGLVFIFFCLKHKCEIISWTQYISQGFVTHLRELLTYLMGSPIGLKLNHAFNNCLGKFFFYHINLWRVFLEAMRPFLEANFNLLLLPALFGLSFQIALICDLISVATFHVYCIYAYSARLFSLQLKGLSSLWRLFIGRKSNPLRKRVDSCEYSSNQLFIGTLGFTILLFLFPTTTMYYTVFAAFRLVILIVHTVFTKIKDLIGNIPLYVIFLWVIRSPSIAGTLHMGHLANKGGHVQVHLKLIPLPLSESIDKFSSESGRHDRGRGIASVISCLVVGQLV